MTTATLTISEFLLARISEDEAVALRLRDAGFSRANVDSDWLEVPEQEVQGAFTERFDVARVLAECKGKAGVIGAYRGAVRSRDALLDSGAEAALVTSAGMTVAALELALISLTLPYADHPDYRQEWRP